MLYLTLIKNIQEYCFRNICGCANSVCKLIHSAILEHCHASVNLDNVLYLENGNVHRRVLKNENANYMYLFSQKTFSRYY